MNGIVVQSLATGDNPYPFTEEGYLSAAGKGQILADWQRFIAGLVTLTHLQQTGAFRHRSELS